jgi:hypothetical protein
MPSKLSETVSWGFLPGPPCEEVMCRDLRSLRACCWEFKNPLHGILRPGDWGKPGLTTEEVTDHETPPECIVHGAAAAQWLRHSRLTILSLSLSLSLSSEEGFDNHMGFRWSKSTQENKKLLYCLWQRWKQQLLKPKYWLLQGLVFRVVLLFPPAVLQAFCLPPLA